MKEKISISVIGSISGLGSSSNDVWSSYLKGKGLFKSKDFGVNNNVLVSQVSSEIEYELNTLRASNNSYKNLDRSVLLAILVSKNMVTSELLHNKRVGINIGSSRGATSLFEKYHRDFQENQKLSAYTSPTTTLGNISSWVGQELGVDGVMIEHSVTCSTAMHAVLNGIAWLQADMADVFLAGGSEAALTPFTIAQMQSLKLYSKSNGAFPCEALHFNKTKNTMVLGEGVAIAFLEKGITKNTLAIIAGYGFASEKIAHNSAISKDALCFQKSMKMALTQANLEAVDAIVMHAPGTIKGDMAEKNAIDLVFGNKIPLLTTNKSLVGHTFATSGMLSMEMAVLMLSHNKFIESHYFQNKQKKQPNPLKNILINAVGFGGNAVSIIVTK